MSTPEPAPEKPAEEDLTVAANPNDRNAHLLAPEKFANLERLLEKLKEGADPGLSAELARLEIDLIKWGLAEYQDRKVRDEETSLFRQSLQVAADQRRKELNELSTGERLKAQINHLQSSIDHDGKWSWTSGFFILLCAAGLIFGLLSTSWLGPWVFGANFGLTIVYINWFISTRADIGTRTRERDRLQRELDAELSVNYTRDEKAEA